MDACWDDRSKKEIYNEKIHKRAHSVNNLKVIRKCLARGKYLKMLDFPKKRGKTSRLLRNRQQVSSHVYRLLCAPVISASIHRYVNYFDIQVLMMATETETLTSTLHHNKFIYLDYIFLLPSYYRILIHIYFHIHTHTYMHTHIYIYIYIYIYILEQQSNKSRLQILVALHTRSKNPNLNNINFEFSPNVVRGL